MLPKLDVRAAHLCARVMLSLCLCAAPVAAANHNVPAGGDLQAALDAAQPGDVILLAAGATYTGSYRLPLKGGNAFITIRTNAPAKAPAPNVRVTPETAVNFAKIKAASLSSPALTTAEGSHHWRLELVEIVGTGGADLVLLGGSGSQTQLSQMPHDIVFDRVYIHGDPVLGQKRGITVNSGTTHVLNSHISDIKGVGFDTQAICGWNGSGPFVIENNYLEAAGENIMFGGADPSIWNLVPSDITVRGNLLSKPLAWKNEKWSVKNGFELKNARRVLVEGNVIENVWQASQNGFAVLFTPRNQGGKAPWSVVEDVTFRHNVVRHAGGAFNITGMDDIYASAQTARIRISNNLVYDIDSSKWGGNGRFVQVGHQARDITIDKNTVLQTGNAINAYGKPTEGFVFRDNIMRHGTYGVIGDNFGAGNASLNQYFPGARFERNVLAGGKAGNYPGGNLFPTVPEFEAAFTSIAGEDFTLTSGSSFRSGATDGGALGADIAMVSAALRGGASAVAGTAPLAPEPSAPAPDPAPAPTPAPAPAPVAPAGGNPMPLPAIDLPPSRFEWKDPFAELI